MNKKSRRWTKHPRKSDIQIQAFEVVATIPLSPSSQNGEEKKKELENQKHRPRMCLFIAACQNHSTICQSFQEKLIRPPKQAMWERIELVFLFQLDGRIYLLKHVADYQ